MIFSSVLFIFGFLPIFLFLYFLTPNKYRNFTALLASLCFYAWGAPRFLMVLLLISWIDYSISWRIFKSALQSNKRKAWVTAGILINLSLLFYFKYSNFFAANINSISQHWLGKDWIHWAQVIMPIGVSFVVFEEISYLVDVYREESQPAKKFSTYTLFLFLFPHSIAGPIFRWHDLENQLIHRKHTVDMAFNGAIRFFLGLGKKVLIADRVAAIADVVFAQDPASLPYAYAWLGILAYTLQIYFDFSGYSDMAIGIGAILGFKFKENFNAPYAARSITDFWKRWHISLSTWMRDYLYIPLGGNRGSNFRTYANLVIVFLVSGFWHGASWNFLAWGAYHGTFLILDRIFLEKHFLSKLPRFMSTFFTMILVMGGWVLFRAESIPFTLHYWKRMFSFSDLGILPTTISFGELSSNRAFVMMAMGVLICVASSIPTFSKQMTRFLHPGAEDNLSIRLISVRFTYATAILMLVSLSLITSKFSPFIYFRF